MTDGAKCRGLSLISGGLDSRLAVCVLRDAGAYVEGVCFETPFFSAASAREAAAQLGIVLHVVDFTAEEIALVKNPPHGFGGAMNPCIDCHAAMIRKAGELMVSMGFDFVATGEVLNQRPMSQNKQSLGVVERSSGLKGRLVRPLCARLLEPTIPETEGKLDREKLLGLSGRRRDPQIALAEHYGLKDYPSPAGGCKLTEEGYSRRLKDLMEHEGLDDIGLVKMLVKGRRFRLPGGSSLILGRDAAENEELAAFCGKEDVLVSPENTSGPTALVPVRNGAEPVSGDLDAAVAIVAGWSRPTDRPIAVSVARNGEIELRMVEMQPSREEYRAYQIM